MEAHTAFNTILFDIVINERDFPRHDDSFLFDKSFSNVIIENTISESLSKISCFTMLEIIDKKSNFYIVNDVDIFKILNIIDSYIIEIRQLILDKNKSAIAFCKRVLSFRKFIAHAAGSSLYKKPYLEKTLINNDREVNAFANMLNGITEKGYDRVKNPPLSKEHIDILYPPDKEKTKNPSTIDNLIEWANT